MKKNSFPNGLLPSLVSNNQQELLEASLGVNIERIKKKIGNSTDIIVREAANGKSEIKMAILYTDGLADKKVISDFVAESLMLDLKEEAVEQKASGLPHMFHVLKDYALTIGDIKEVSDFESLFGSLLSGDAIILLDGISRGITASSRGWKDRGVTEPSAQTVVRGPREAFSETLRTNTALIRRRIKDPNLWLETVRVGKVTKTDVAIMYINGIANEKVVQEVRDRIERIDIDGVLAIFQLTGIRLFSHACPFSQPP
ncbi:spore germination protein [Paenibacillus ehimensis]|uniref:Spore germination protein n=1 Tax=Paenibacillus ehimensis TaxID=79264 RepID=A0ABT8VFH1_9BACL|nr:spore germination protein [Paenibacillus ehimensis]MDO3679724.1 spore germination protein [Paenibacillus ehimensis]